MRGDVRRAAPGGYADLRASFIRIALAAALAVGGCSSHTANGPRALVPAPAPAAAVGTASASAPAATPVGAFRCGPRDPEWDAWFDTYFGHGVGVLNDGPDPRHLSNLSAIDRERAVIMLRRGLHACDLFAVQAIERAGWRELLPDLEQASAARNAEFRVHVILALRSLGGERDHTDQLIAALGSRSGEARMSAAIGARHFPLERMRAPLLDLVRTDPDWLVRHHAAESLLDLADIYPRALNEHPGIYNPLTPTDTSSRSIARLAGMEPPPTPEERAGFADAAAKLDAAITARLAAGDCAKATPFNSVPLYILLADEHLAAVVVEHGVGPCERTLAFIVFVRTAERLGRWVQTGSIGRDPVKTFLATRTAPVPIEYHRATHSLTVGNLVLDTTETNVALLSTGEKGVVAQYRSKDDLTFVRHGRPPQTGFDTVVPAHEITEEIHALLNRSPALKALVSPATPPQ